MKFLLIALSVVGFVSLGSSEFAQALKIGDSAATVVSSDGYSSVFSICRIRKIDGDRASLACPVLSTSEDQTQMSCEVENIRTPLKGVYPVTLMPDFPNAKPGTVILSTDGIHGWQRFVAKAFGTFNRSESGNAWVPMIQAEDGCWRQSSFYPVAVNRTDSPAFGPRIGSTVIHEKYNIDEGETFTYAAKVLFGVAYEYERESVRQAEAKYPNLPTVDQVEPRYLHYVFSDTVVKNLGDLYYYESPELEAQNQFPQRGDQILWRGGHIGRLGQVLWSGCRYGVPEPGGRSDFCGRSSRSAVLFDTIDQKWQHNSYFKIAATTDSISVRAGDLIQDSRVLKGPLSEPYEVISGMAQVDSDFIGSDADYLDFFGIAVTESNKKYLVFECSFGESTEEDIAEGVREQIQKICAKDATGERPKGAFAIED